MGGNEKLEFHDLWLLGTRRNLHLWIWIYHIILNNLTTTGAMFKYIFKTWDLGSFISWVPAPTNLGSFEFDNFEISEFYILERRWFWFLQVWNFAKMKRSCKQKCNFAFALFVNVCRKSRIAIWASRHGGSSNFVFCLEKWFKNDTPRRCQFLRDACADIAETRNNVTEQPFPCFLVSRPFCHS